jgi:uncharacterized DUF497 family protein
MASAFLSLFRYLRMITPSRLQMRSPIRAPRFVSIGLGAKGRVLVVVYSYRGEIIRIISARAAEPHERLQYEDIR